MVLMPRSDGFGVRGSGLMCELCSLVGLRNVSVRVIGRRKNKFYIAQCFAEALQVRARRLRLGGRCCAWVAGAASGWQVLCLGLVMGL